MRESQFLVAMEQEGWVWKDSFREAKMKADFEYAELVEMEWLNCFQALVKKNPSVLSVDNEKYFLITDEAYFMVKDGHFEVYIECLIERLSDSDYRDQWDTHYEDLSEIVKDHISRLEERSREVVLAAVKQDGGALKYASEALKSDREVVLAAVRQNGGAAECFCIEIC
mgnify:CR=1 FL=1